jgi:hypothetical protein
MVIHMVWHQAIGPYLDTIAVRSIGQQIEIERIIPILEKRAFPPVTTLRYVMRNARENHARKASHECWLSTISRHVNLGAFAPVTVILVILALNLNP